MLNDIPNVMTELAPKGPRFVEIIEIMDCRTSPSFTGYPICWLMRDNNRVLETAQQKLPVDLTHKLCKTDMINMNDIPLLNTSESFPPDSWCHVEYKIILYCDGSRMVNEKWSFISMLLINCQLMQIISAFF